MTLKISELNDLVNSVKYGHSNVISKNENFTIVKPLNTWDTNYRLYDIKEEMTYLIDCDDVQGDEKDLENYGGVLYTDLLNLEIETIKEIAWKTEQGDFY